MQNKNILVVEDENIIALEIMSRLENLGYHVPAIVSSGEAAIEKTEEYKPDIILMDIRLRGKYDGIEAAKKIQEKFQTPIIYLTAYADDSTIKRAQKISEKVIYLLKPFSEDELKAALKEASNGH